MMFLLPLVQSLMGGSQKLQQGAEQSGQQALQGLNGAMQGPQPGQVTGIGPIQSNNGQNSQLNAGTPGVPQQSAQQQSGPSALANLASTAFSQTQPGMAYNAVFGQNGQGGIGQPNGLFGPTALKAQPVGGPTPRPPQSSTGGYNPPFNLASIFQS